MTAPGPEPPRRVSYNLEEALALLAILEDARDALTDVRRLVLVMEVEAPIRALSRKLGLDTTEGGADA